jgi:glucose-6-phosphate 1-dehydrogenase
VERIVIFGATGDLAARYLMPALAKLYEADKLPPGIKITGVDRQEWDDEHGFRRLVLDNLEHHAGNVSADARATMAVEVLEYRQADVTDAESVISALEPLTEPIVAYLALPPAVFAPTLEALKEANLPEGSRVAVEKPFGVNLESAQELNRLLHGFLPEGAIFRIDHFLAWQPFQTIMGLRFANGIFEPLWDRNYIERVEIIWEETLALEGRAGYFDHAGAFKDLIQNHLIQLLCLTAMEAPTALHRRNLRDRKVDLLRAVRRLSPAEAQRQTVRARYGPGTIGERHIPAYADEEGGGPLPGDRDLRRSHARDRQPALGWGAVRAARRQGPQPFSGRDRRALQSGAPPRLPAGGRPPSSVAARSTGSTYQRLVPLRTRSWS